MSRGWKMSFDRQALIFRIYVNLPAGISSIWVVVFQLRLPVSTGQFCLPSPTPARFPAMDASAGRVLCFFAVRKKTGLQSWSWFSNVSSHVPHSKPDNFNNFPVLRPPVLHFFFPCVHCHLWVPNGPVQLEDSNFSFPPDPPTLW